MNATVYFSRDITPETVLNLYQRIGKELHGNVAVKVHSGEKGNQNFLKPESNNRIDTIASNAAIYLKPPVVAAGIK